MNSYNIAGLIIISFIVGFFIVSYIGSKVTSLEPKPKKKADNFIPRSLSKKFDRSDKVKAIDVQSNYCIVYMTEHWCDGTITNSYKLYVKKSNNWLREKKIKDTDKDKDRLSILTSLYEELFEGEHGRL